jgi:hypothetical protein
MGLFVWCVTVGQGWCATMGRVDVRGSRVPLLDFV